MRALPAILLALLASACSSAPAQNPAPSPSPSADPVNVAACLRFSRAQDQLRQMAKEIGPGNGWASMLISGAARLALEDMSGGAGLARGGVKDAMDRAVTAVGIVQDRGGFSTTEDLKAVRLTLVDVTARCREVGADVELEV
ncbi:hypothetical protein ACIBI0_38520 [Microbispora rosea]|uniref:hypothetical protein n=1 Tax=Microbispora rosea TaxID=58117 RepID=UPI003789C8AB